MVYSQRGLRISMAMSRVAEDRKCERCGRLAALVTFRGEDRTVVICRWAKEGKCADPGTVIRGPLKTLPRQ